MVVWMGPTFFVIPNVMMMEVIVTLISFVTLDVILAELKGALLFLFADDVSTF